MIMTTNIIEWSTNNDRVEVLIMIEWSISSFLLRIVMIMMTNMIEWSTNMIEWSICSFLLRKAMIMTNMIEWSTNDD
jgi:hypothetical protein